MDVREDFLLSRNQSLNADTRVLSVQSHVVCGCVGNRAVVFPLQLLGFDTDFINTVEFSNHTGYPHITGTKMSGSQLEEIVHGLTANQLLDYDIVISGYIGKVVVISANVSSEIIANVLLTLLFHPC